MMSNEKLKELTRNDWKELGFYYESNKIENQWLFIGSKTGLYLTLDKIKILFNRVEVWYNLREILRKSGLTNTKQLNLLFEPFDILNIKFLT